MPSLSAEDGIASRQKLKRALIGAGVVLIAIVFALIWRSFYGDVTVLEPNAESSFRADDAGQGDSAPRSTDPSVPGASDELMIIIPANPSPGEFVEAIFPNETPRGTYFVLQEQHSGDWKNRYYLFSDANGGEPDFVSFQDVPTNFSVPAVRVSGPGPDRLLVPTDISEGQYRICTLARESLCALITLEGSGKR